MEKMTCETFLKFHYLSDPVISPDGRYTAYIRRKADLSANGYDAELWLYDHQFETDRQLTTLSPVKAFSWADAETLLFASSRGVTQVTCQDQTTYYTLSIHGGEAQKAFTVPVKSGVAQALGDGRFVLTAMCDTNRPDISGLSEAEAEQALTVYHERTYDVLEDVPFWTNGMGITSGRRASLCVYDSNTDMLEYLTEPPFKVAGFTVKDGKVLYTGSRFEDIQSLRNALYVWDAATGESRCLLEQDRYLVKLFELWRNKAVLCLTDGISFGNGQNGDFYTVDLTTGQLALLARHDDRCVGNTVGTDCKLGSGATSRVCGDTLYYISTVEGISRLEALDLTTGAIAVLTDSGSIEYLDASQGRVVYLAFRGDRMGELYALEDGKETRLTHANDIIYDQYAVSTPEYLEVETGADLPIQGWVLKPVDYQAGKKYPAILSIHGGPRLSYGTAFFHEMQVWAANGYFVVFCNPRGSEGRGNGFADIRSRFGTIDYEDIISFLDGALARYADIDPERLGVGGGSYGGFMTNWIIGHTNRFKAACSQRSIANWTGMEGTTDIGYYFAKGQTGASHREDRELQWRQSPLRYADKVTTPTLFIHGDQDYRCWKLEAIEMFMGLKIHGVPTRLCLFEGENHELSRSGRPKQRLQRLEEMLAWYDKYLKEQEA